MPFDLPGAVILVTGSSCRTRRRTRESSGKIDLADECRGFRGAVNPVHADILPLDREGSPVGDIVQGDDDVLELDVAVAERPEIPVPARVSEARVPAEHAGRAVAVAPPDVLHVHVVDAFPEGPDELHIVDALVAQV